MSASYFLFRRAPAPSLAALAMTVLFSPTPAHALTEAQQDAAIASLQSAVATLQSTVSSQQTTINTLTTKLQYVTASGHDLTLTGNLHVVSGAGHTNSAPNGQGNVIIGYNELRTASGSVNDRTGSHCLVLGSQNNYSSYGGMVAGFSSSASGTYATVTGGYGNTASGSYTAVNGGKANTASATCAAIGGGNANTASANYAAVGGGTGNSANVASAFLPASTSTASLQSFQSQINGLQSLANGLQTQASNLQAAVTAQEKVTDLFSLSTDPTRSDSQANTELTLTGVNLHIVNGLGATNGNPGDPYSTAGVVNGLGNIIIGYNETRVPENTDLHTGSHNLVIGVRQNYNSFGGLVAGYYNDILAPYASITGGNDNIATGLFSSVTGGYLNSAVGFAASVSGGQQNYASGNESSLSGGYLNTASAHWASVSGGTSVLASSDYSWAGGTLHSP